VADDELPAVLAPDRLEPRATALAVALAAAWRIAALCWTAYSI
jgi:hypothetical protein